jgi:hypothetical protein
MNPNQVPIQYTLNIDQVNLILSALGKMPYEQVAEFVNGLRGVALKALQEAEEAAKDAAVEVVEAE